MPMPLHPRHMRKAAMRGMNGCIHALIPSLVPGWLARCCSLS
jgi:hypothetical protein